MDAQTVIYVQIWVQMGVFVLTIGYVLVSFMSLRVVWKQREQTLRPYVIVDIEVSNEGSMSLVIKNIGNIMAKEIIVRETPEFSTTINGGSYKPSMFKNRIKFLPPAKQMDTFMDSFDRYSEAGLPMDYQVQISYIDGLTGKEFEEEYMINLEPYTRRLKING